MNAQKKNNQTNSKARKNNTAIGQGAKRHLINVTCQSLSNNTVDIMLESAKQLTVILCNTNNITLCYSSPTEIHKIKTKLLRFFRIYDIIS